MNNTAMQLSPTGAITPSAPKGNPDYYDEKGLLVCGTCHKRKQFPVPRSNLPDLVVHCRCDCYRKEQEAEDQAYENSQKLAKFRSLGYLGYSEKDLEPLRFERDEGKHSKISGYAWNYARHFAELRKTGSGILFYGPPGTGKTFLAGCIANKLKEQGYFYLMTSCSQLFNGQQGWSENRPDLLRKVKQFDLLVIDDLGAEQDTGFMNSCVFDLIDACLRAQKPMVITTNLSPAQLKDTGNLARARIYSRVLEVCTATSVLGADRRLRGTDPHILALLTENPGPDFPVAQKEVG